MTARPVRRILAIAFAIAVPAVTGAWLMIGRNHGASMVYADSPSIERQVGSISPAVLPVPVQPPPATVEPSPVVGQAILPPPRPTVVTPTATQAPGDPAYEPREVPPPPREAVRPPAVRRVVAEPFSGSYEIHGGMGGRAP